MGSVNASTQDMEMKMHNVQWVILYYKYYRTAKGFRVNY